MSLKPQDALDRLRAGNLRFVAATRRATPETPARPITLVQSANPFAVILTCADARVPPEIIFDARIGDLFVIRVAGNVAGPTQIGSVEFAASAFGVRLVVVLGHTGCAAINAALDQLDGSTCEPSPSVRSILDLIRPAVTPLLDEPRAPDRTTLAARAVRANIGTAVGTLRACPSLRALIEDDALTVVGARYDMKNGSVVFNEHAQPHQNNRA